MNSLNSSCSFSNLNLRKYTDLSGSTKENFYISIDNFFIENIQNSENSLSRSQLKEILYLYKNEYNIDVIMNGDFFSKEEINKSKVEISKLFFNQKTIKDRLGYNNFQDLKNINIIKAIEKMKFSQKIELIKKYKKCCEDNIDEILFYERNKLTKKFKNLDNLEKLYNSVSKETENSEVFFDGFLDEGVSGICSIYNIFSKNFDIDFFISRLRYMVSIEEIKKISQNNIDKKNNSGYLYFQRSSGHFDTLLIDEFGDVTNLVICDLRPVKNINRLDASSLIGYEKDNFIPDLYKTDITWLIKSHQLTVFVQKNDQYCGSIGLNYLREMLKNGVLENLSLKIKAPWGETERKFFVPPPQALAHAQCSTYADILYYFVTCEDDSFKIPYKSLMLEVRTLQSLLDEGAKIQRRPHFDLKKFRSDYAQAYEAVMAEKYQS